MYSVTWHVLPSIMSITNVISGLTAALYAITEYFAILHYCSVHHLNLAFTWIVKIICTVQVPQNNLHSVTQGSVLLCNFFIKKVPKNCVGGAGGY